ncbi:hypothetical protein [Oceanobacillus kapialis]|uniref:Uncharacterized protein n=1 Tax=Oceanobacillus kapialis TaxID=481353 RepID=A0ABW5PY42_9BACI
MDFKKGISMVCVVLCVLLWVPNILYQLSSPLWLLTFPIAAVGLVFGWLARKSWLMIGNTLMFFSFFIVMAVGHVIFQK